MRTLDHIGRVAALLFAVLASVSLSAQRQAPLSEVTVKAAYVYQFGTYVEWPPQDPNVAFTICILGEDPFGRALDELVKDENISGRPITIRRILETRNTDECRILFVSPSEDARLPAILKSLEAKPVLTVGDGMPFLRRGGMIAFTLQDRKVRFAVNLAAATSARLMVSSQLLRHATEVRQ